MASSPSPFRSSNRARRAVVASIVLATSVVAASARADDCEPVAGVSTCLDADLLWPRAGVSPFLFLGTSHVTPTGQVGFGIVASYASRPVVIVGGGPSPDGRRAYVVDNLVDTTYLFALGVAPGFEVTFAGATTLYQDGAGLTLFRPDAQDLPRSTVRDVRFGFSYELVAPPRAGERDGFGVTPRLEIVAPTGDGDSFSGASGGAFVPSATVDFRHGPLLLAGEVGARVRKNVVFADARWGTQITGGLGADVVLAPAVDFSIGAEAFVAPGVTSQQSEDALVPAEWSAHAAIAPVLGGDLSFQVAGGGAIPFTDASLTAPRFRFGLGIRYAPRATDRDGDGVLDRNDACPEALEDVDGFEDADGCPDPDNDRDRVPDARDKCRDEPETIDGFDDADGCPDLDDDGDGVPDESDQCRSEKEDNDGFQDEDGCPDPDDDGDGIPDKSDECPRAAEDLDGVKDEDGCPDLDDDRDGVPDKVDRCKTSPEDQDGFQDEDGCPEPDDDHDGILDGADRCVREPETIDGNDDGDGCPEPGATSQVRLENGRVVTQKRIGGFVRGSAEPSEALRRDLRMIAQVLRGAAPLALVIVEAFPDRIDDRSARAQALAAERAEKVRTALVADGVAAETVTAAAGDPGAPPPAGDSLTITAEPARAPAATRQTPP